MGKIDLLLVNPAGKRKVYSSLSYSLSGIEPPLWSGLIAAYIRKFGYSVKIIDTDVENLTNDETVEKILEYDPVLVVVIVFGTNPSASTTNMTSAGEILSKLKEKNSENSRIKTAIGGLHPSVLPERTLREENVDFVIQGEGFYTIRELLETLKNQNGNYKINGLWYIKNDKIISNPASELIKDLDELPFAACDLLPMDKYRAHNWHCFEHINERNRYAVLYTSLGCPFSCRFCCINGLYGKPGIRFRSPEKVIEEIDLLVKNYNIKNLKIIDELFVLKEDRVIRICDLIIERGYNLNIWAYARVDTVNEKLLKKLKQAGVNWIAYGFESMSKRVLDGVSKKTNIEKIKKAIEMTKSAGIYIIGNFIFGLPDDDLESMNETFNMAKEFNFEFVNFYTAMAYPGSKLYEDAKKTGIKLPETWHGYSQYSEDTLPMGTKYLSSSDVLRFRDNAFVEYFSDPEYIEMIRDKFGDSVVEHIKEMLKYKINRKYI